MMTVIVIVVILIVAIIGGIIYMVTQQEKSKGKLGSAVDLKNDVLVLDADENLALSSGTGNNLFIIDGFNKCPFIKDLLKKATLGITEQSPVRDLI